MIARLSVEERLRIREIVREVMENPATRKRLFEALREADEVVRQLQEARKPDPGWRDFRVTI